MPPHRGGPRVRRAELSRAQKLELAPTVRELNSQRLSDRQIGQQLGLHQDTIRTIRILADIPAVQRVLGDRPATYRRPTIEAPCPVCEVIVDVVAGAVGEHKRLTATRRGLHVAVPCPAVGEPIGVAA